MPPVKIIDADPFLFEKQKVAIPMFNSEDYQERITRLLKRMAFYTYDFLIIYGDREHFANIEYFTSYDCRFEEALLIVRKDGELSIIIGNEGMGYSQQIPLEINRYLYQDFSLQGQPREASNTLGEIMSSIGLQRDSNVGIIGYKYFEEYRFPNAKNMFDIPAYILQILKDELKIDRVSNCTKILTGLPDGLRMRLYTAKEAAWAEASAVKASRVVLNILEGFHEGISESEASRRGSIDFSPISMFGLVNFGSEHVAIGLRSPGDEKLSIGDVCGICYGIRGSLVSRNGVVAYDHSSYKNELKPHLEDFYMEFWEAITVWYENLHVGVSAGTVYEEVMEILGKKKFNLTLNPGHNIATDEWTNSSFFKGSTIPLPSGSLLQSDMIASSSNPVMSAICEDTVLIADENLRNDIKAEYPEFFARVLRRQEFMRTILGIRLDDSVLPLSNLNAVYFPYMLNTKKILAK